MGTVRRFEELNAWQTARALTARIYALCRTSGLARDLGLARQMQRAAVSILSNVAEGFESQTQPMFISYLNRSKGSAGELRAQLYVALDAGYINKQQFEELVGIAERCSGQISRLITYLKSHPDKNRPQKPKTS